MVDSPPLLIVLAFLVAWLLPREKPLLPKDEGLVDKGSEFSELQSAMLPL